MKKILPILSLFLVSVMSAATPEEVIAKAEAGDLDAMTIAAENMRYSYRKGWPKDPLRADQWAQKALEKGHPPAVAIFYTRLPEDQREKALRKAADAGHEPAFAALAKVISEINPPKITDDERSKRAIEAYSWAKLASESSNKDAVNGGRDGEHTFTNYISGLRYRESQKKNALSLSDSPDRIAAKGQDAAKQLAERMKKKFPDGFPVWPPADLVVPKSTGRVSKRVSPSNDSN